MTKRNILPEPKTQISRTFKAALKLHDLPAYRIAQLAGLNPVILSKLINEIEPVKPQDERILAVAQILKIRAEDCFDTSGEGGQEMPP